MRFCLILGLSLLLVGGGLIGLDHCLIESSIPAQLRNEPPTAEEVYHRFNLHMSRNGFLDYSGKLLVGCAIFSLGLSAATWMRDRSD